MNGAALIKQRNEVIWSRHKIKFYYKLDQKHIKIRYAISKIGWNAKINSSSIKNLEAVTLKTLSAILKLLNMNHKKKSIMLQLLLFCITK